MCTLCSFKGAAFTQSGKQRQTKMLKRLFTSSARIKLLRLFLLNPEKEHFIRQLTRDLDEQINSVRRELDNLKKMGLLKSKMKFRKKYYAVNPNFIFLPELRSIFLKAESSLPKIADTIASFGDVKLIIFSGLFIEKETSVDLVIVGPIDKEKLTNYLNNELRTKRAVRFTTMTEEDFKYRIKYKDKFVMDIINDKDSIIPLKRLDIDL